MRYGFLTLAGVFCVLSSFAASTVAAVVSFDSSPTTMALTPGDGVTNVLNINGSYELIPGVWTVSASTTTTASGSFLLELLGTADTSSGAVSITGLKFIKQGGTGPGNIAFTNCHMTKSFLFWSETIDLQNLRADLDTPDASGTVSVSSGTYPLTTTKMWVNGGTALATGVTEYSQDFGASPESEYLVGTGSISVSGATVLPNLATFTATAVLPADFDYTTDGTVSIRGNVRSVATFSNRLAATYTWNAGSSSWATPGNWKIGTWTVTNFAPSSIDSIALANGGTIDLGGGSQSVVDVGASGAGNGIVGSLINGNLAFTGNMYVQSGTVSVNLSNSGGVGRLWIGGDSSATVYLGGNNTLTYSDNHSTIIGHGTTGAAGTVKLLSNTALSTSTQQAQVFAGTLDLNGQTNVTVGSILLASGASSSLVNNNTSTAASTAAVIGLAANGANIGGNGSLTLSGIIGTGYDGTATDAYGFTKTGSGTLTLTANNIYTGATTISAGTLQLGNGTTNGSGTVASASIVNNAALVFNYGTSTSQTYGGAISGTGSLTKKGAGILTLTGSSNYNGLTTLNSSGGFLVVTNSQALGNSSGFVMTAAGGATNSGALILSGSNVVISRPMTLNGYQTGYYTDENLNYVGAICSEGGSNTVSGAIKGNGWRSYPRSGSTLTFSNASMDTTGASYFGGNGSIVFAGNITGSGGTSTWMYYQENAGAVATLPMGTLYFTGNNSAYTGAIGWYTAQSPSVARINLQNANALPAGGIVTNATTGSNQCLQLQWTGAPGGGMLFASSPLTLYGTGGSVSVGGSPINLGALENVAGNNTWTGPITLGSATLINSDSGTLTLSGNLINAANPLTIGGAGNTTITGIISPAATAGGLTKADTGILTLTNNNNYTGVTTVSGGTLQLGNGSLNGTIAGTSIVNNASLVFNYGTATSPNYAGIISGTGSVSKTSGGTATLSGPNTYTGATGVTGGVLEVQNATALGTTNAGASVTSGATLKLTGNGLTVAEPLTISGGGINATVGALYNTGGNNTWSGPITLGTTGTRLYSNGGILTIAGGLNLNGQTLYTGSNIVVDSVISGAGGILIQSIPAAGTITLKKANIYSGSTYFYSGASGVLNIQHSQALGDTATGTTIVANSTLQLQPNATTGPLNVVGEPLSITGTGYNGVGALQNLSGNNTWTGPITLAGAAQINSDGGLLTLGGNIVNGTNLLTVGGAGNTLITGVISPSGTSGGLTKTGTGILTLTGANAYTGLTTVNGGVLDLVDATAGWTAAFQQLLTSGGSATIQSGRMVFDYTGGTDPKSAIDGLRNTPRLYAGASANPLVAIDNGTLHQVTVLSTLAGDANLDASVNGADLNIVLSNYNQGSMGWTQGDFDNNGSVNGADLNIVLSNYNQSASAFAAVPEPAALLTLAIGLIGLVVREWRRRRIV
jgi:fibronectin-binding autotransporter adhesin